MVIRRCADSKEFTMNDNTQFQVMPDKKLNYFVFISTGDKNLSYLNLQRFDTPEECYSFIEEFKKAYESGKECVEFY